LWEPVNQTGLLAVWDPHQQQGGQLLIDISGNDRHAQLGSTSGADTNDPAWVESPAALSFGTNDFCTVLGSGASTWADIGYLLGATSRKLSAVAVINHPFDESGPAFQTVFGKMSDEANSEQYLFRVRDSLTAADPYLYWRDTDLSLNGVGATGKSLGDDTWGVVYYTLRRALQEVGTNGVETDDQTRFDNISVGGNSLLLIGAENSDTPTSFFKDAKIGPILLYEDDKTAAEMLTIYNDIKDTFPEYSLP
jgi:hypothetical protein